MRITIPNENAPARECSGGPANPPTLHDVPKGAHVRVAEGVVNDWMPTAGKNDVP